MRPADLTECSFLPRFRYISTISRSRAATPCLNGLERVRWVDQEPGSIPSPFLCRPVFLSIHFSVDPWSDDLSCVDLYRESARYYGLKQYPRTIACRANEMCNPIVTQMLRRVSATSGLHQTTNFTAFPVSIGLRPRETRLESGRSFTMPVFSPVFPPFFPETPADVQAVRMKNP